MAFASEDLRYLYDQVYADSDQIGTLPESEAADKRFREDVHALIRWRKDEGEYPFHDALDSVGPGSPGFNDVGLPMTWIGNRFPVIDARQYVADTGGYRSRSLGAIERLSIHHSVTREPVTKEDELTLLREIGSFHVYGRDWPGYAYHWSLAPSGRIYYTGDMATTRYIVGRDNPFNCGICVLGNFTDHPPTAFAQEQLRLLIGEIGFTLGADKPYYGHGETPGAEPTSCPGASYPAQWTVFTGAGATTVVEIPQPALPPGVRSWSDDEIVDGLVAAAGERALPARALVGLAIAESGLDQFAERWGTWPDVSFGIGQQTVKYSPVGDGSQSEENIALVQRYFSDPGNAIPVLADHFSHWYHHPDNPGATVEEKTLAALSKYNSGQWEIPEEHAENLANYLRGLDAADAVLADL